MTFADLPLSLRLKLASGRPWVLEPHERGPLDAYLNEHHPITLPSPPLPPTQTPLGFLAAAMEEIAAGLDQRCREVLHELQVIPHGPTAAPGDWDALTDVLGPELTAKIRNTP